ncbi:hypothetical protein CO051_05885 [Candidatus Roizmanbacteria bacterium CG_4_9_14_0_2_um_filter_39_13]|uniref:Aminoacyl-transfer RNA synthetases class-II family profile domain-containing protein n=2 Tax=Candidatus Roizmaniibacteriota TaxID=1752723 RepID=A0A2M8EX14_9BACT|nr:MAG: hypothetical protein COY15_03015 [Candidatus Roizmanbacteria bacterium CG_4_10_14_0_2_um_filter_39_12]PJC30414.1 MAG: hypothetical protein CO051_05885 [Candidatus Roizmanbacteria bacterium CG_4_9_14_0_2_um_filter_39_13]PJE62139.1 MAG: hypothetical protein COU87_00930 [Candidatus Roizmanbacteria bacterium CG10_big_fil_rev_8_21_14_0_10_39_12]
MESYFIREKIIKIVRNFFYSRDFHEVIPPILNSALPLEPHLKPFTTTHTFEDAKEVFYLPMSPEKGIKQMISQGIGNCFAISQSFRNYERIGPLHAHEFLMLEWYRKDATYKDIMAEVEVLLGIIDAQMSRHMMVKNKHFPRFSLELIFEKICGEKLSTLAANDSLLRKIAKEKGFTVERNTTWQELYDQLFVSEIEPILPQEPLFLIDFPARISPLCTVQKNNPFFVERFELYIHGIELANGNTENTDTKSIRAQFEKEHKTTKMPIDEAFLGSLELMKGHTYGGVGLGIDRLAMMYAKNESIHSHIV